MKNLYILIMLLAASFSCTAQRYNDFNSTNGKYEISIMTGRASDLTNDFVMHGDEFLGGAIYFNSIRGYRNLGNWQVGAGLNLELKTEKPTNTYALIYKTPHVVFNRIQVGNRFSYYAGVMVGYALFKYDVYEENYRTSAAIDASSKGSGIVGGVQGGINVKVYKFIHFNVEVGGRIRKMKGTQNIKEYYLTNPNMPNQLVRNGTRDYSTEEYFMPFRFGLRLRF